MSWAINDERYLQARACGLVGLHARTFRRKPRGRGDGVLRTRLKALAAERRRFGYRRLHILLRREGFAVNHKRLFRIYREERLMVRKRGGRKRAIGTRAPLDVPQVCNARWSLDFVSDALSDGPPLPHSGRGQRLLARVLRLGGRHVVVWCTCCPRTR